MKFLYPTFLFALFTIAIPIIIHLFSFRQYKTVYFSNVDFLKDIKKESKKKSRLKQLLLLLARILTIIFLVFAFAQPYIPINTDTQKQPNQIVAIYVDNSFSMNALSEQGQLLEAARNKALEICMAYPPGTKYRLFTNDLEPKHQNIFNKEQFIQQVSEIHTSPIVIPYSMIYNRFSLQNQIFEGGTDKILYFISDFQRNVSDIENFGDKEIFCYFLPLVPNQIANLYIDSCWVEVPAHRLKQEEEIFVRIKNSSDQDFQNLPLNLYLNDSIKSITNFSVKANNEITASLKYNNNTSGSQLGKIEISDYPFTHDNQWYISYYVEPKLKALAIFNKNNDSQEGLEYISALFENDDYVQLDETNIQSLQISSLSEYNTIFLIHPESFSSGFLNELENAVDNGTSVVLFPANKANPLTNNTFLSAFGANRITGIDTTKQKISGIDFDNNFFKDVFRKREENPVLPEINGHFKFENNVRTSETRLLWFQNNDKALSQLNFGNGKVWVFSFSLTNENAAFARDILYVPTIYNIVLNSLPNQKMAYSIGKNSFYEIPGKENINLNSAIEVENKTSGEKFIPAKSITSRGTRLEFDSQINAAGHYFVRNDNTVIATLSFNYDRKESDLRYLSGEELNTKIEAAHLKNARVVSNVESNFSEILSEIQNGKQLWKWALLLALFFILAEVTIARFMK